MKITLLKGEESGTSEGYTNIYIDGKQLKDVTDFKLHRITNKHYKVTLDMVADVEILDDVNQMSNEEKTEKVKEVTKIFKNVFGNETISKIEKENIGNIPLTINLDSKEIANIVIRELNKRAKIER